MAVLLGIADQQPSGACCIILPSSIRVAFGLAVLAALSVIRRGFDELELDRLTLPLNFKQPVRVAPGGKLFVYEGETRLEGRQWIRLRNPTDDQIRFLPVEERFRLAP